MSHRAKELFSGRRVAGYLRYDTEEEIALLNEIYSFYELYVNFFQPMMKLKEKVMEGSKIKKRYDKPKTPYERVLECEEVEEENREKLRKIYENLNPIELKAKTDKLQSKLVKIATRDIKEFEKRKNFEYIFS